MSGLATTNGTTPAVARRPTRAGRPVAHAATETDVRGTTMNALHGWRSTVRAQIRLSGAPRFDAARR